jgi:hypothetical protein
LRLAGQ